MVDGREFVIAHRDLASFPPGGIGRAPATAFVLWEREGGFRLLNALLVADITPVSPPWMPNGDGDGDGPSGEETNGVH